MTFAQMMRKYEKSIPLYSQMYDNRNIRLWKDAEGVHVMANAKGANLQLLDFLQTLEDVSFMQKLQVFMTMEAVGAGPKIFRPTAQQLFALEKMRLNLSWRDFATPYKLIIIELPEEYRKARHPQSNCAMLYYDKDIPFFIHGLMYDETVYQTWWSPNEDESIEEWLVKDYEFDRDMGDLPIDMDERPREQLVRRASLNYCLLLDEVGIKSDGPAVPNQYAQLVKWCAKKTPMQERNKQQLRAQPMLFSLKRPTELVRVVGDASELPPAETGRVMSPHSRRGHYRMQPCGSKGQDRKRIRIPPTIVNKHLLMGPPTADYKT